MNKPNLDFSEKMLTIITTYLLTTFYLISIIFLYEGFPSKFTNLDIIVIIAQLIGLIIIMLIPLIYHFFSKYKIIKKQVN